MWSTVSVLAALSFSSASPIFRRDDCDVEGDDNLSCVVYKFSAPFNDVTSKGQAEFIADLTTYTFNEKTNGGEFTNPQIVRLGVGSDSDTIVRCEDDQCAAGNYFSFEVCESKNSTQQYGANDPQLIYGHIVYQKSGNDTDRQCVSAGSGEEDVGGTGLSGSTLSLRECVYDLSSSVDQGQYWRMLMIYDYPVVSLVTASNETYYPDPALVNEFVPLTLSNESNLSLGSPYTWFSFQIPPPVS